MKKSILALSCITFLLSGTSMLVYAKQDQTMYQEELYTLSTSLKAMLDDKKELVMEDIKSEIIGNGWDYELTMENIQDTDPFKKMDYIRFISAYMAIKKYSSDNQMNMEMLGNVPIIRYEAAEDTVRVPVPKKIPVYKESKTPGKYLLDKEVYIMGNTESGIFEKGSDGYFYRNGTETIEVDMQDITYANVTLTVMTPDELFDYYGIDKNEIEDDYEYRINSLSLNTGNTQIYQAMYTRAPSARSAYNLAQMVEGYASASVKRRVIAEVANSLVGQVPYQWGGKARKAGYDNRWWLFNDDNEQIGLDCSGFVQWVYITSGYDADLYSQMISTNALLGSDLPEVSKEQLQIGDIGVKVGPRRNHMGIYAGKIDGEDFWIHCNSTAGTVSVNQFEFQKFYSPISLYEELDYAMEQESDTAVVYEDTLEEDYTEDYEETWEQDTDYLVLDEEDIPSEESPEEKYFEENEKNFIDNVLQKVYYTPTETNFGYSYDDVYLLAQLTIHEAGNEGLNGWVAVGEVVKNRVEASEFPDTISEVIYQAKQFSHSEAISSITPTEEVINTVKLVLEGKISVLDNARCLYFRNPMITDGISVTSQVDWGRYKYYMAVGNHAFYLQP